MTPIDFEAWVAVKNYLSKTLEEIDNDLSDNERELLKDLIKNNEYGLALDWINSIIAEKHIQVSERAAACLREIEAIISR